jgi:heme exporter protein A
MDNQLQARQLGCVRGTRRLFAGVDVDLRAGAALRVAGPNGSGKSSLLRILCGLAEPHAGSVTWQGRAIRSVHANLVYLGHAPAIKDDLTALENLMAGAALAGAPVDAPAALSALADAGLRDLAGRACGLLSEGQRKRVALARLQLAEGRRLWVLDEPFSALDGAAGAALAATIDAHLARGGLLVYTTHQDFAPRASRTLTLGAQC